MPLMLVALLTLALPAAAQQGGSLAAESLNKRFHLSVKWSPRAAVYNVTLSRREDEQLHAIVRWTVPLAPLGLFVRDDGRRIATYGMTSSPDGGEMLGVDIYAVELEQDRAERIITLRGPQMILDALGPETQLTHWVPRGVVDHHFDGTELRLVMIWDSPAGVPRLTHLGGAAEDLTITLSVDMARDSVSSSHRVDRAVWHGVLLVLLISIVIAGRLRQLYLGHQRTRNDARQVGSYTA